MGDDEQCVTIVAMASYGPEDSSNYLLQLIAGRLRQPVVSPTQENWREFQTYYVSNNSLYAEIKRKCELGLMNLSQGKRKKIMDNPPFYVVTSNFPSRTFSEKFRICETDVITAVVSFDPKKKLEVYTYQHQNDPELCIDMYEPASPMLMVYRTATATEAAELIVTVSGFYSLISAGILRLGVCPV